MQFRATTRPFPISLLLFGITLLLTAQSGWSADSLLVPAELVPEGWRQLPVTRYGAANASRGSDGDADLYLECGLDSLFVARLKRDQNLLSIRLHRLPSVPAALAMYLMKCGPEQPSPDLGFRNTFSNSELLAVRGNWLLYLGARGNRDSALMPIMLSLASHLLPAPPPDSLIPLLDSLPRADQSPGTQRVVIGPLTFPSALRPLGPELLGITPRNYAVAADYLKKDGDRSTVLLLTFLDKQLAEDAFINLGLNLNRARRLTDRTRSSFKFRSQASEPVTVKVKKNHLTITIERGRK